jgi:uncharacterized membrane protein
MNILLIILRLIHIVAGAYWVGAAWMTTLYIEPTSRAAGAEGQKFMQKLMEGGRFSRSIAVAAVLTVVAGAILYYQIWWQVGLNSSVTLGFTFGAIVGIIALVVGGAVTSPASAGLSRLGAQIAAGGQPPTPEQLGQIKQFQARLAQSGRWTAVLTAISLAAMAVARYL